MTLGTSDGGSSELYDPGGTLLRQCESMYSIW